MVKRESWGGREVVEGGDGERVLEVGMGRR